MDIYYHPSEKVLLSDPDYYKKYALREPLIFPTEKMPNLPINPKDLSNKVIEYLEAFDNVISDAAPEQIELFCRLFNENIHSNQNKENYIYVNSAQTGSAKSLSLKTYVSMLENESSLIVVAKVSEAIKYCEFINEASGNPNYAKCFYTINEEHPNTQYRVEHYQLKEYRCIVISHKMFQILNTGEKIDLFKLYNNHQRDLVVVDEKIDLYNSYAITKNELQSFKEKLDTLNMRSDKKIDIGEKLLEIFEMILSKIQKYNALKYSPVFCDNLFEYDEILVDMSAKLNETKEAYQERISELFNELKLLCNISNTQFQSKVINDLNDTIKTIEIIFANKSMQLNYYKSNIQDSLFHVDNIVNQLGTVTVLDATANINEFYKVLHRYSRKFLQTSVNLFRTYHNLTIHKAKGFTQGRSSTFRGLPIAEIRQQAQIYISHALSELKDTDDKMLIITHKDFKKHLMDECNDPRIQFTHWGDHVGKNQWNDCNKVVIVGWNFINELSLVFSVFNALGSVELGAFHVDNNVIQQFRITQLVEDFVQGIMRTQARKVATRDGDCKKTDVFIYYDDGGDYAAVLDLLATQFPKCQVEEWTPKGLPQPKKKTKPVAKVDAIIAYLANEEKNNNLDVPLTEVIEYTKISKATMSRLVNSDYCKEQLLARGYTYKYSDKKSMHFVLK